MSRSPEDKVRGTVRPDRDQPIDDLIDFPCSSLWLDHYADLGLTPRRSASLSSQVSPVKQSRRMKHEPPLKAAHLAHLLVRLEGLIRELRLTLMPLRRRRRILRTAPQKAASKTPRLTGV